MTKFYIAFLNDTGNAIFFLDLGKNSMNNALHGRRKIIKSFYHLKEKNTVGCGATFVSEITVIVDLEGVSLLWGSSLLKY